MPHFQSKRHLARSFELFNALFSPYYQWHTHISENTYQCAFRHEIPPMETHFVRQIGPGDDHTHVCFNCMEVMLDLVINNDKDVRDLADMRRLNRAREFKVKSGMTL
ncbi:MAG: hypothetical protein GXO82_03050 [Chlorobi bacterium]|nr:hypothetical protein [Chlorobiota bacterium]